MLLRKPWFSSSKKTDPDYEKNDNIKWNFTRLGKIDGVTKAELKKILGKGNVTAVLSVDTTE